MDRAAVPAVLLYFNLSYEYIYWGLSAAFELVQSRIERKFGKGATS